MKTRAPYNIWVNHCANGETSFAEYINAKRCNFYKGRLDDPKTFERVRSILESWLARNRPRKLAFAGDPLPDEFKGKFPLSFFWTPKQIEQSEQSFKAGNGL